MRAVVAAFALFLAASQDPAPLPGLLGEYYDLGDSPRDFPSLVGRTPYSRRIDRDVNIAPTAADFNDSGLAELVAIRWSGLLRVETAGPYTFYLESDDGSRLHVDGKLVVNNGGPHGMEEKNGETKLEAGDHEIAIDYFDTGGSGGIKFLWSGPDIDKQAVPAKVLFHKPDALDAPLPADAEAAKLRWKLLPTDFARYRPFRSTQENGKDVFVEYWNRACGIFGYEIEDALAYKPPKLDWTEIPLILGFSLPSKSMKVGGNAEINLSLENTYGYEPLLAQGSATRQANARVHGVPCIEYALQLKLRPNPKLRPNANQREVQGGTFEAIVDFDAALGAVRRLRFDFTLIFDTPSGQPNIKPETLKRSERLDLVAVLPYRYDRFKTDVNKAIERGEAWIRRGQQPDGNWGAHYGYKSGPTALALLTLLKGTPGREDAAIKKGLDWLLKQPFESVYEVGVSMMAVEEFYAKPGEHDEAAIGKLREADITRKLSKEHLDWMTKAAQWLEGIAQNGGWSYKNATERVDFSNTQYGLLGLQAAARCGVTVDENVYAKLVKKYVACQQRNGPAQPLSLTAEEHDGGKTVPRIKAEARGWGYYDNPDDVGEPATESMTCGGISSLAIGASVLARMKSRAFGPDDRKRADEAVRDGWAWMAANFSVKANVPKGRDWHYYTLYGLERAASLNGVKKINEHDWYFEGAVYLISNQASDGAWCAGDWVWHHDVCFAVLFLKRATIRVATGG